MRISYSGVVLIGVLMLCSAAAAADTQISLKTSTDWLVAGSGGTSTITVTATNGTTTALVDVPFDLSLNYDGAEDSTLTPLRLTSGGEATAIFKVGKQSGDVTITATTPDGATKSVVQHVDHAAPCGLAFANYTSEDTVESEVPIVLAMEDRYDNRIDNRWEVATGRDAETVTFSVGSLDDSAVFVENNRDTIARPVDENGNVTATLKLGRTAGENIVFVDLPAQVADAYFTVYGSGGVPASITYSVLPISLEVPGDGKSLFTITYTLKDAYGNPSGNRSVEITTSLKDEQPQTLVSNSDGVVMITYGPQTTRGSVTITAASVDAPAVTTTTVPLTFTSTAPVDMVLSASPQTMPSLDVNSGQKAEIRAKVTDEKGSPVMNATVTFALQNITCNGGTAPHLEKTSAVTDEDGYAVVEFVPGSLPTSGETASGECDVVARWGTVTRTTHVVWENYPFLSVETDIDPETVELGDTVGVTVHIRGDGWALSNAGEVNASVNLDFSKVFLEVNGTSTPLNGSDVFQYVYAPAHSTHVYVTNQSESGHVFDTTLDQTGDWNDDQHLTFDVENVQAGQHWWAKFRLTVLKPGNIRIFGSGSTITFNGGEASLALPETYISIVSSLNRTGFGSSILDVYDLSRQGSGEVGDFLQVGWKLNYTGNESATQRLYYSTDEKHTWTQFATLPPVTAGDLFQTASLDVRELPAGYYYIRVHATAPDAPDSIAELDDAIQVGSAKSAKIRLE